MSTQLDTVSSDTVPSDTVQVDTSRPYYFGGFYEGENGKQVVLMEEESCHAGMVVDPVTGQGTVVVYGKMDNMTEGTWFKMDEIQLVEAEKEEVTEMTDG